MDHAPQQPRHDPVEPGGGATHTVFNQPGPLEPFNAWRSDRALREAVRREGGAWAESALDSYGAEAGGPLFEAGFLAERNPPQFHSHDRYGHRINRVEFHPAYHQLMRAAVEAGLPSLPWTESRPGAHVARAALEYMHNQADSGSGCPLTMSFAAVPALRAQPDVTADWLARLATRVYDGVDKPWHAKPGVTLGMAMTEKQGGTDVRANTTRAVPLGAAGQGQAHALTGHKWFCSAPMCDGFLVLAQAPRGLSCFLVPRWHPDGELNGIHVQRLKNKLGNRSNASSEIELRGAFGWMIGAEGRGVPTIIDMVMMTRFDCVVGSASLMRQALAQALHHCAERSVSGRVLAQHALMQNVLADLALESEAALAVAMRLARRLDEAPSSEAARLFVRVATAVAKYWVCKRAPGHINEAAECMGGAGYVEDSILPRLYREAPVNSTWEGSGNVQCIDVLRAFAREPEVRDAFLLELAAGAQRDPRLARWVASLETDLRAGQHDEYGARALVGRMALALAAAALQDGDPLVAEAFSAARLGAGRGLVYGELPAGIDCRAVLERAHPAAA
jgi:putative acyl-CoA dehydrogenase